MLSIQRLVNETGGKWVEVAGAPKYQCVDLVNYWLRMLGKPLILWRNAIDFNRAPGYEYHPNTPSFIPEEGDIAIFNIGLYGDVAVVAAGTDMINLKVYGQNYPIGAPCRFRTHYNYGGVMGFLRLSHPGMSVDQIADEVIDQKWGNGQDRINRLKAAGYDPAAVQAAVNRKLS